jgi:hypothetical protein
MKSEIKIFKVPFLLEGFETVFDNDIPFDPRRIQQFIFSDTTIQEKFDLFCNELFEKSEKKQFYPIYRMADGEFIFLLGKRQETNIIRKIKSQLRYTLTPYAIKTIWGEKYTKKERSYFLNSYIDLLQHVSKTGSLAIHFTYFEGINGFENYYQKVLSILNKYNINLTGNSYIPFYFVYAFLAKNVLRKKLLANKRILVISSFDEIKKKNIEYYLFDHSTKSVSFYDISPEKSMFEKIEFSKIEVNPDIVLVAGGIGAINIIVQFEKLNVLIIDCGMALEVMANPALKKKRVFLCSNE